MFRKPHFVLMAICGVITGAVPAVAQWDVDGDGPWSSRRQAAEMAARGIVSPEHYRAVTGRGEFSPPLFSRLGCGPAPIAYRPVGAYVPPAYVPMVVGQTTVISQGPAVVAPTAVAFTHPWVNDPRFAVVAPYCEGRQVVDFEYESDDGEVEIEVEFADGSSFSYKRDDDGEVELDYDGPDYNVFWTRPVVVSTLRTYSSGYRTYYRSGGSLSLFLGFNSGCGSCRGGYCATHRHGTRSSFAIGGNFGGFGGFLRVSGSGSHGCAPRSNVVHHVVHDDRKPWQVAAGLVGQALANQHHRSAPLGGSNLFRSAPRQTRQTQVTPSRSGSGRGIFSALPSGGTKRSSATIRSATPMKKAPMIRTKSGSSGGGKAKR